MRHYLAGKIRNIALTGHAGSGKTSLAEALLYKARAIDRLGTIADGNTVMDYDPEEIRRESSLSLAVYPFSWGSVKINLLDAPGLFDFEAGVRESIAAAESVLITISGRSGVTVGAKKAYNLALKQGKARMFFINKLDTERADFYRVLEDLKANFGPSVFPLVVPYAEDHKVQCYINLVDQKAYQYDDGGEPHEVPLPEMGHRLDGLTGAISEAVAETSEDLFEKYFSGEPFTRDEIIAGIHKGVKAGSISPVLCGSATTLAGIDMLLDSIADHLPSAWDSGSQLATEKETGDLIEIPCTDEAPVAAFVFKTVADPFVGKLSYVKVISGKLSVDHTVANPRTGKTEKLGKVVYLAGKQQQDTAFITAGDIGAVIKLSDVITGDTLCDPAHVVEFQPIEYPRPTYSMAIEVTQKGDEGKIAQSMARLIEEDPTILYGQNPETKQQLVTGLGEQHLDVLLARLANKFGIHIALKTPKVAYRETLQKKVKVEGKYKKQTGGHGQFGHVWIEFEPYEGEDLLFETNVFGGAVPKNYFPAVEKGLEEATKTGVLAGFPVVGLKATLTDGSYHPVDSSELAFKQAAHMAYRDAMTQAKPMLLEPVGILKVQTPEVYTGDIMSEFSKRRGNVTGMNPLQEGGQEIVGQVPVSEMMDFTNTLRAITQGEGSFEFEMTGYEPLPKNLEEKVIAEQENES